MLCTTRFCLYIFILTGFVFSSTRSAADDDDEYDERWNTNETTPPELEDLYIEHFGNDIREPKPWRIINAWYYEVGTGGMKAMCAEAHEKAGYGTDVRSVKLEWYIRLLNFTNKEYKNREIDVVTYSVVQDNPPPNSTGRTWSVTEGVRNHCLFYLYPIGPRDRQYKLKSHVCGIRKAKELSEKRPVEEES